MFDFGRRNIIPLIAKTHLGKSMPRSLISDLQRLSEEKRYWADAKRFKPASASMIRKAERRAGFKLPELLRRIYAEVANGGFLDLMGLEGGATDDLGHTAIDMYLDFSSESDEWPVGFLPIRHEGCAQYLCVDARLKSAPVYEFDPTSFFIDQGSWTESTCRKTDSLREWVKGEIA